jgi:hypothetical protein
MHFLSITRLLVFILTSVFGLASAALSGQSLVLYNAYGVGILVFTVVGIAAGVLTLLTLPIFVIIDTVRKGAFTSMIVVELITLTILWVLWLATAVLTNQSLEGISDCSDLDIADAVTTCQDAMAVEGLSFLAWIILLIYTFLLLVFSIIASTRGRSVWTSSVKDANFFAPAAQSKSESQTSYPLQQVTYTTTPSAAFGTQQVGTQHMYPNYHMGAPVPQQGIPFQGAPMQQVPFQGGRSMIGTPYQVPEQQRHYPHV